MDTKPDRARGLRSSRIALLFGVTALACGLVAFSLVLAWDDDPDERQPATPEGSTLAAVAAEPERFRGTTVTVEGRVVRTAPGRFVMADGRRQILAVPGLRERAVRVRAGDRVRVTGTVRVIDRSTPYEQADPIPDYDGRAALVPGRVETVNGREPG